MDTWAIFIDIEGFSNLLISERGQAAFLIRELADGIHRIGSLVFPRVSERLFAYGLGDGFLIVPDLSQQQFEKPLAIAIVLLHRILALGGVAKASISIGETSDVSGWFTESVRSGNMGQGIILSYPIMGSALVNAFHLGSEHRGAVLILDSAFNSEIPEGICVNQNNPPLVDWIHCDFPLLRDVASRAGLPLLSAENARVRLSTYIESQDNLDEEWIRNSLESTDSGRA
ncbi:MAG: hypothetical protein ACYC6O_07930 [Thermoleophilia bacterium]